MKLVKKVKLIKFDVGGVCGGLWGFRGYLKVGVWYDHKTESESFWSHWLITMICG